jgi:hypothetical protein
VSIDDDQTSSENVPAAPSSALARLRARRQQPLTQLHIDLAIPRYDPPIYVRYKPIAQTRLEEIGKRAEKSKERDATAIGNATVLAESCVGIFELDHDQLDEDGNPTPVSIDPDNPSTDPEKWHKFDKDLVTLFALDAAPRAAEIVRQMYFTDGDVAASVVKLGEFSGYSETDLERAYTGN